MINSKDRETIYIEQANVKGWKDVMLRHFGGVMTSNSFQVNSDKAKIMMRNYEEVNNISFFISEVYLENEVILREIVDKEPVIIIRFVRNGSVKQYGHESLFLGQGHQYGACMYSTKHPMDLLIPAKQKVQMLAVRIPVEHILSIVNEKFPELYNLVDSDKPWIIYEPLSFLIDSDLERVFELQRSVNGITGYSLARCLDISTHFFLQVRKRIEMQKEISLLEIDTFTLFQIKDELEQNIKTPPSIEDLTEKYMMSASKLRSNFKNAFGVPPRQYLIDYRLREAKKRIIHSESSFVKIAEDLGFSDPAHLSAQFKKKFNTTPTLLRKQKNDYRD